MEELIIAELAVTWLWQLESFSLFFISVAIYVFHKHLDTKNKFLYLHCGLSPAQMFRSKLTEW